MGWFNHQLGMFYQPFGMMNLINWRLGSLYHWVEKIPIIVIWDVFSGNPKDVPEMSLRMWTSPEWWMSCTKSLSFAEGGCDRWVRWKENWSEWIVHFMSFWEVTEMRIFFKHTPCFCYQVLLLSQSFTIQILSDTRGAEKRRRRSFLPSQQSTYHARVAFSGIKLKTLPLWNFLAVFHQNFDTVQFHLYVMIFQVHLLKQKDTWQVRLRALWLLSDFYRGNLMVW